MIVYKLLITLLCSYACTAQPDSTSWWNSLSSWFGSDTESSSIQTEEDDTSDQAITNINIDTLQAFSDNDLTEEPRPSIQQPLTTKTEHISIIQTNESTAIQNTPTLQPTITTVSPNQQPKILVQETTSTTNGLAKPLIQRQETQPLSVNQFVSSASIAQKSDTVPLFIQSAQQIADNPSEKATQAQSLALPQEKITTKFEMATTTQSEPTTRTFTPIQQVATEATNAAPLSLVQQMTESQTTPPIKQLAVLPTSQPTTQPTVPNLLANGIATALPSAQQPLTENKSIQAIKSSPLTKTKPRQSAAQQSTQTISAATQDDANDNQSDSAESSTESIQSDVSTNAQNTTQEDSTTDTTTQENSAEEDSSQPESTQTTAIDTNTLSNATIQPIAQAITLNATTKLTTQKQKNSPTPSIKPITSSAALVQSADTENNSSSDSDTSPETSTNADASTIDQEATDEPYELTASSKDSVVETSSTTAIAPDRSNKQSEIIFNATGSKKGNQPFLATVSHTDTPLKGISSSNPNSSTNISTNKSEVDVTEADYSEPTTDTENTETSSESMGTTSSSNSGASTTKLAANASTAASPAISAKTLSDPKNTTSGNAQKMPPTKTSLSVQSTIPITAATTMVTTSAITTTDFGPLQKTPSVLSSTATPPSPTEILIPVQPDSTNNNRSQPATAAATTETTAVANNTDDNSITEPIKTNSTLSSAAPIITIAETKKNLTETVPAKKKKKKKKGISLLKIKKKSSSKPNSSTNASTNNSESNATEADFSELTTDAESSETSSESMDTTSSPNTSTNATQLAANTLAAAPIASPAKTLFGQKITIPENADTLPPAKTSLSVQSSTPIAAATTMVTKSAITATDFGLLQKTPSVLSSTATPVSPTEILTPAQSDSTNNNSSQTTETVDNTDDDSITEPIKTNLTPSSSASIIKTTETKENLTGTAPAKKKKKKKKGISLPKIKL